MIFENIFSDDLLTSNLDEKSGLLGAILIGFNEQYLQNAVQAIIPSVNFIYHKQVLKHCEVS